MATVQLTACEAPTPISTPTSTPLSEDSRQPGTDLPAATSGAIRFRRLTLDDGLSQSSINCITQDTQGFMWFGTQDGLDRYDGYEFRVYRNADDDPFTLSDSYVMGCESDRRGVLWVVVRDGTLHRYEPETDRLIRYDLELEDPLRQRGTEIRTLHGDAEGGLWIGTHGDGLVHYDPDNDSFTTYRHDPEDASSLGHRVVNVVYEATDGTIWVGTEAGLNRYDPETDGFVRYPYRDFPAQAYQYDPPVHTYDPAFQPQNSGALASPAVTALLEDRDGTLWVGTRYGGLNRLDPDTHTFTAYPFDPEDDPVNPATFSGNSVRALLEDSQGAIWVASTHWNLGETRTLARLGLEELDPHTGTITRHPADAGDACSLSHDAVQSIYEDRRGTLWIHTFAGGLDVYDRASGCFRHYSSDPADPRTLSDDGITRYYEDDTGGLWLGTELGGVSYYDPTWAKFPHYTVDVPSEERLSNNSIWHTSLSPRAVDAQGHAEALWIATFAGLNYWDRRTNTFTYYEIDPDLPDVIAYDIYEEPGRRQLWVGTQMGLSRAGLPEDLAGAPDVLSFTRVLTRTSASQGFVLDIQPAGDDLLWLAHYGVGLSLYDLASEQVVATYPAAPDRSDGPLDDRILDIFAGRGTALWLTTPTGVDRFDPERETFTHYVHDAEDPEGIGYRVFAVYEESPETVWLGTDGDGLQRLDTTSGNIAAHYRDVDGLPNNVIYSILPDGAGYLWLSTNRGLSRFDPVAEAFRNYTADDGLQSNEFNLGTELRAPDGELFFGGINGINAFYPNAIGLNTRAPRVVITDIALGPSQAPSGVAAGRTPSSSGSETALARPANMVTQLNLTYRDRILSFEFAALHFAVPERNSYAYMLAGFDEGWHYVGNRRFATYTNLPPGRYTFRVKAANSDGVWNELGTQLAVSVAPPFWATWWFRGLVGVLLVGAVAAGYGTRVRAVETRSRELEVEVANRTKELAAVNAIAGVVSRSLDLDAILSDALDTTLEVMGVEAGGIYLLSTEQGALSLAVHRGLGAKVAAGIDNLGIGEGFSGEVAASGKPLVVQDVAVDDRLTRAAVREAGLRALAVVPVSAKGNVLGTLFAVTQGTRRFSAEDIALLVAIGQQIGVAVENARLYEDTRARLAQLSALQETTTAVASTLELESLLHLIIGQATELLQARGGILNMVDWEARQDYVVAATGSATVSVGIRSPLEASLSGWATLHRQPVLSNDLEDDPRVNRDGLKLVARAKGSPLESAAAAPLVVKGEVVGTLVLVDKVEGYGRFDTGDLDLLQTFANQAATAIENARLFEAEKRRAEQFRLMSEVGSSIASILALDELLTTIARLIQEAFGYYHVGIGLIEGDDVVYRVGAGPLWDNPQFQFTPARLKVGSEGVTGWVAGTGEPLLIPDVREEPRYVWMRGSETRSELTVPIKAKGTAIGVLDAQSDELGAFDESDVLVLQSLAYQAGVAIDNARLYQQARRLAVVEERQRLARELHDSVTQALYGVTLYAEATARQLAAGQTEIAADHLAELRDTAHEALREMRLLIFELRPAVLEREGLVAALRARLEAVEERAGLGVSFHVDGAGDYAVGALPPGIEGGLYRIAQEALNNALKHAAAQNVSVRLEHIGDDLILEIADDGIGFDPDAAVRSGGLGLDGMVERAAEMGGQLELDSRPGGGTRVRVIIGP